MLATARNEFDPAWSPTGDQFAFVTDRSGTTEIWTRSRDGVWERPLVTAADFGASRTETLASLAFSPDGRTLAYQRGGKGPGTSGCLQSPAGRRFACRAPPRRHRYHGHGVMGRRGRPTASGSRTPTTIRKRGAGQDACRHERERRLLRGPLVFSRPVWSPDGNGSSRKPKTGWSASPPTAASRRR